MVPVEVDSGLYVVPARVVEDDERRWAVAGQPLGRDEAVVAQGAVAELDDAEGRGQEVGDDACGVGDAGDGGERAHPRDLRVAVGLVVQHHEEGSHAHRVGNVSEMLHCI